MNWTNRDKIMLAVFGALCLGVVILAAALRWWRGI